MDLKTKAVRTVDLADRLNAQVESMLSDIVNKLVVPPTRLEDDVSRTKLLDLLESAAILPHLIKIMKLVIFDAMQNDEELHAVVTNSLVNLHQMTVIAEKINNQAEML